MKIVYIYSSFHSHTYIKNSKEQVSQINGNTNLEKNNKQRVPTDARYQKIFDRHCQLWYDKYKDSDNSDNPDIMGPDGCQTFFSDIGVSLESVIKEIDWK